MCSVLVFTLWHTFKGACLMICVCECCVGSDSIQNTAFVRRFDLAFNERHFGIDGKTECH